MSLRSLKSARDILSHLKTGIGSSPLPHNITKISLQYAIKGKNECAGAKHFLQENMPRLQYNNPNVEFELIQSPKNATQPTVVVHYDNGKQRSIEIPRMLSDDICNKLYEN